MTKAKTVEAVRERELYFTNVKCNLVKHGNKSKLIKVQKGKNTFICGIKRNRL